MLIALTRGVSANIASGERTYQGREPINLELAKSQHKAYSDLLKSLGAEIERLPTLSYLPDAVFVEDTAIVLDEVAIMANPGASSRRPEVQSVADKLAEYRPLRFIGMEGTLDGGDVFRVDKTLFVGLSTRTNAEGIAQLRAYAERYGYTVKQVSVTGVLHLKSACTYIGHNTLLANRAWIDSAPLADFTIIDVPETEPAAADTMVISDTVILPASFPATRDLLEQHGFKVQTIDVSELQKAEAGVSCMSILLESRE